MQFTTCKVANGSVLCCVFRGFRFRCFGGQEGVGFFFVASVPMGSHGFPRKPEICWKSKNLWGLLLLKRFVNRLTTKYILSLLKLMSAPIAQSDMPTTDETAVK